MRVHRGIIMTGIICESYKYYYLLRKKARWQKILVVVGPTIAVCAECKGAL